MKSNYLTILLYHGVTSVKQNGVVNYSGKHINVETFDDHMKFIKQNCNILNMDQVVEIYNDGNGWPKNSVAVTFDDGFQNNYLYAADVLDKYKVPATFYVCAGMINSNMMFWVDIIEDCVNRTKNNKLSIELKEQRQFNLNTTKDKIATINEIKKFCKLLQTKEKNSIISNLIKNSGITPSVESSPDYKIMTWNELNKLKNNKLFTIGGHTLNHEIMSAQNIEKVKKDINDTLSLIDKNLSQRTTHFSYPEGQAQHYNNTVIKSLIDYGIICSPSAIDGVNLNEDLFNLKRIMPNFMGREFPFSNYKKNN